MDAPDVAWTQDSGTHDPDAKDPAGIAIVGMACRFPGAPDVSGFWRLLCTGQEGLSRFDANELHAAGVPESVVADPAYVMVNGVLREIEGFDAGFFGMTPREASITDPQHRILLELAWEALESSGHEPGASAASIGVYAGCGASAYLPHNLWPNWHELSDVGELRIRMGNGQEYLATRLSYKLNLVGPSISVNTACSTSLVAVHLACDALTSFQCDMALAGGISVQLPQLKGYRYDAGGILSPDGHCRAFDASAQGTVSGNGGAVVVLKRLADAVRDSDFVYAVIRGTAVNNDGAGKSGFTAPSGAAQRRAIEEAQQVADIDPATIGYVEAHGTGTPLGDPVEFAALAAAFRARTDRVQFCGLGSLKTNVGHLDEGAGVAGLVKTALCLHHRQIPPSLHFHSPNKEIDYAGGPFYVADQLRAWEAPPDRAPRRAAVSSFGIGGTNAHAVLEQAPAFRLTVPRRPVQILPISAATQEACLRRQRDLAAALGGPQGPGLSDVAYTMQVGRRAFAHRGFALGSDAAEAGAALAELACTRLPGDAPPVVFMFTGQGTPSLGVAADLCSCEPTFRSALDQCAVILTALIGLDIRDFVCRASADTDTLLRQTRFAQPALFAVEYALAQLWLHWGVRPAALIGHSLGEYVALCVAGALPLQAALRIVARRGALMNEAPEGAMLAVPLAQDAMRGELPDELEITAANAPDRCTVGGPAPAVAALADRLRARGLETAQLQVAHAFHTRAMQSTAGALERCVAAERPGPLRIPVISNVTGDWLSDDQASDPAYYARQLCEPVQFAAGIQRVLRERPTAAMLEIGPGSALTQAARRCGVTTCLASLPGAPTDAVPPHRVLLASLGRLWQVGVAVDWQAFAEPGGRRVPLPTYPFARERHWIDPPGAAPVAQVPADERVAEACWCYRPTWTSYVPPGVPAPTGLWLLLADVETAAWIAEPLRAAGCRVATVAATDDFLAVLTALPETPQQIVWLWSYGPAVGWSAERWCVALLALLQAMDTAASRARLAIGASGLAAVEGDSLDPEKGTLPGLIRSAALEYPERGIRLLDLPAMALSDDRAAQALISFCGESEVPDLRAWRRGRFWQPDLVAAEDAGHTRGLRLRRGGTYLVTGGLGGIGLSLANALARDWGAFLVLIGRTPLPPRDQWDDALADPQTSPPLRHRLLTLSAMEARGATMLVAACDVTDRAAVARVIADGKARFGAFHGVIHASGVADGTMLALRDPTDVAAVLSPKVGGLRVLADVLAGEPLDLMVLCSALSAETGAPGQAAYCAANSYLNLFAEAGAAPWPVVSIGWDAWREVGMAAWTPHSRRTGLLARLPDRHDGAKLYGLRLSGTVDWVMTEHRIGGVAVLPGTAYLNLVWRALRDLTGAQAIRFRAVDFVQPLVLSLDQDADVRIDLEPEAEGFHFVVATGDGEPVCIHAQGWVAGLPVAEARASDAEYRSAAPDAAFAERLTAFGPHWHCAVGFAGPDRDHADIALPDAFAAETELHPLHPALLDIATGFPVLDRRYDAALLPAGYASFVAWRPLPAHVLSRLVAARSDPDGLTLDLELSDPDGNPVASVEGYSLRHVRRGEARITGSFVLTQAEKGRLDTLHLSAVERQGPPAGTVEIEVHAAEIEGHDTGLPAEISASAEPRPAQFGLGCAGRVVRVGEGVAHVAIGDAVMAYAAGCLASHVAPPAAQVLPLPPEITFAEAATLTTAFAMALHALVDVARLRAGETILIHVTNGGLGCAAIQVALGLGAQVLATADSDAKCRQLLTHGARAAFSAADAGFVDAVRAHTNQRGVDVVLNTLSRDLLLASLDCLAPYGRCLEIARHMHGGGTLELARFAHAITVSAIDIRPGMPGFAELLDRVARQAADKTIRPLQCRVFPIERSSEAFAYLAGAHDVGPVVLAVKGDAETVPPKLVEDGLSPAAGVATFTRCVALGGPRVIVSTRDWAKLRARRMTAEREEAFGTSPLTGSVAAQLAAILGRLLGHPAIDHNADFFTLGGDSLIGAQFVAEAARRLRAPLTLRDLFDKPTIAGLAAVVEERIGAPSDAIRPAAPRDVYPLSHAQQRLWIAAQDPVASFAYNMSYALSLTGALDVRALERAFEAIVQRHESLRTAFVTVAGMPGATIHRTSPFALPFTDLSDASEAVIRDAVRAEAMTSIRLDRPPLLRAELIRRSPNDHLLLVSMAHIVADGMSVTFLMHDLEHCYAAYTGGREPSLPPLQIQFKDFAVWERQRTSAGRHQNRAYWLETLMDNPPVLHLPTDRPRPPILEFAGSQITRRLPAEDLERLRAACKRRGVTLFMLLAAALLVVLHEASGDEEILLGTPVAGRERDELHGQIGYYLNNVVLRNRVRRSEPFADLLARVRDTVTEALAHQDYPFDLLIEDLSVEIEPGRSPLFDVQINLMPGETRQLQLGDLVVRSFESNSGTTLFDLNFMFSEAPQELLLGLGYRTSLFNEATVADLGDRVMRVLALVAADLDTTVRRLCEQIGRRTDPRERDAFLIATLDLGEEF